MSGLHHVSTDFLDIFFCQPKGCCGQSSHKLRRISGVGKRNQNFGITVSSLRITKVYKGNLQIGDTIALGEDYYTMENDQNKTVYHFGNYMPSTVGQEYLFLLVESPEGGEWWDGIYLPMYSENGRFPVPAQNQINARSTQSLTNRDLNLGEDDSSVYRAIYKEALAKYMS